MIKYFSIDNDNSDFYSLMKIAMPEDPLNAEPNEPIQPVQPNIPQEPQPAPQANINPQPQQVQNARPPQNPNQKSVQFVEEKRWGLWLAVIVSIPALTPSERKQLESIASLYIESQKRPDGSYPTWSTWRNPAGKIVTAPFKLFSPIKGKQATYALGAAEPVFFEKALNFFKEKGYDTQSIDKYHVPQQNEHDEVPIHNDIFNDNVVAQAPAWNVIDIKFKRDIHVTNFIDSERVGGKWNPTTYSWTFTNSLPSKLKDLASFMKKRGFITTDFEKLIKEYDKALDAKQGNRADPNRTIVAKDVSNESHFLIAIQMPKKAELISEMKEFVKFSFPSVGDRGKDLIPINLEAAPNLPGINEANPAEPVANQDPNQPVPANVPQAGLPVVKKEKDAAGRPMPEGMRIEKSGFFYLYGNFDDFVRFGNLLKNSKWNIDQYRTVFGLLVTAKKIKKERYSGELDGYLEKGANNKPLKDKDGNPLYNVEKFYDDVAGLIKGGELMPKQKQGVAWLYSRNSAILGDKAGTGKTLETIAAAAMRLKQSGGRALIFVLKNTVEQWADEIRNWLGDEDGNSVSNDPSSNAKWVVISYSSVSAIPKKGLKGLIINEHGAPTFAPKKWKAQEIVNKLFAAKFTVMILDEAHVLKNENAGVSQVLNALAPKIPFKWGATATPGANTSGDFHNVLSIIGHTLGKLSGKAFNEEFVGGKMTTKNMADEEVVKAQEKAAYNLRKWLTLSGAYLSRSMRSMNPDLPPHEIGEYKIAPEDFDMEAFSIELNNKINSYKNPAVAICGMTAARLTLANMKVPYTLNKAKEILDQGKRVLVFSCFRSSCDALAAGMKKHLLETDPGKTVVHIKDGDKPEQIQMAIKKFRDHESNARAMVIASLKGGTGVSLPNSTEDVLMNDFDWTPRVTEQTEGRAFRINNVMPVNTQYTVIQDTPGVPPRSPDATFYRYVRTKIRLSSIIQDLDAQAEEYILKGLDDAEIQLEIEKARAADRAANVQLAHDLDELLRPYVANADMVGGNMDVDAAWEEQQLLGDDGGDEDPNAGIRAMGWYGKIKTSMF